MLLLVTGALFGTFGHFLFILAFQRAPASGLTPFTYVQLVWATLVGWIAFGDLPDEATVIGMAIIADRPLRAPRPFARWWDHACVRHPR